MAAIISISALTVPVILLLCALLILFSKKDLFTAFLEGAKNGLQTTVQLIPTLVLLMTAVSAFSASGSPQFFAELLSPLGNALGFPSELLPLIIVRPVSGSASIALIDNIFKTYGPDSTVGLIASVIMGSSDTVVYILSIYFGAVHIKKTRHAMAAALLTMLFSVCISCLVTRLLL